MSSNGVYKWGDYQGGQFRMEKANCSSCIWLELFFSMIRKKNHIRCLCRPVDSCRPSKFPGWLKKTLPHYYTSCWFWFYYWFPYTARSCYMFLSQINSIFKTIDRMAWWFSLLLCFFKCVLLLYFHPLSWRKFIGEKLGRSRTKIIYSSR